MTNYNLLHTVRARALATMLSLLAAASASAVGPLVDAGGVYYRVDEATRTAVVSIDNRKLFQVTLADVVIPAKVIDYKSVQPYEGEFTVIGMDGACFAGTGIATIDIQIPITELPDSAFFGCSSLKSVTLPASVVKVGDHAFEQCTSLEKGVLPEGLTTLGEYAYYGSGITEITIPAGVKRLPEGSLSYCRSLDKVTLSEGLEVIGSRAFDYSTVRDINLPSTLKEIEKEAFCNCSDIFEIAFPKGVHLAAYAFRSCGIKQIKWPEPFTYEKNAISGDNALKTVKYPAWMKTVDRILDNPSEITWISFDEGVEAIADSAFYRQNYSSKLNTVYFPESLRRIGKGAFLNQNRLTGVCLAADVAAEKKRNFPDELESIGEYAFAGGVRIDELYIPRKVHLASNSLVCASTNIYLPGDDEVDADHLPTFDPQPFGSQTKIKTFAIPGWMKRVPDGFFMNWRNLATVTIAEGVEELGTKAFASCALTELPWASTIKKVGDECFSSNKFTSLTVPEAVEWGGYVFAYNRTLTSVTFPEDMEVIPEGFIAASLSLGTSANYINSNQLTIKFPKNVTTIGAEAFRQCTQLYTPDLNTYKWQVSATIPKTVRTIGAGAFRGSGKLFELDLSEVTDIGTMAFAKTTFGGNIKLPQSNCQWGESVFSEGLLKNFYVNDYVFEVEIPGAMTEIPTGFFNGFSSQLLVTFHEGVAKINDYAFRNCSMMRLYDDSVEDAYPCLPKNLKSIGVYAFENAGSFYKGKKPAWEVMLPEEAQVGQNAFNNANIKSLTFSGCAEVARTAFANCTGLESVTLPGCMTEVPSEMFSGCTGLKSVIMPKVKSIGSRAFYGCTGLTEIDFSATPDLEEIGESAFQGSGLTAIIWGDRKLKLHQAAFRESALTSVEIPAWLDSIPQFCFERCAPPHGYK